MHGPLTVDDSGDAHENDGQRGGAPNGSLAHGNDICVLLLLVLDIIVCACGSGSSHRRACNRAEQRCRAPSGFVRVNFTFPHPPKMSDGTASPSPTRPLRRRLPSLSVSVQQTPSPGASSGVSTQSPPSTPRTPSGSVPASPRFGAIPHRANLRDVIRRSKTRSRITAISTFTSAVNLWSPSRDVATLEAVLSKEPKSRSEADVGAVTAWLQRNPSTAGLFTAVPEVLLSEILREATLLTVDSEVEDVLLRQGSLQDTLYVVLRGNGVCYRREPTGSGGYVWNADEVALDEHGRLPVRADAARHPHPSCIDPRGFNCLCRQLAVISRPRCLCPGAACRDAPTGPLAVILCHAERVPRPRVRQRGWHGARWRRSEQQDHWWVVS
jgi:hypothetical protein